MLEKFTGKKFRKDKEANNNSSWVKDKLLPSLGKMANQRHFGAIRDSFGTMLPLIISGSIGILINTIIFGGGGSGYISLMGLIAKMANPSVAWTDLNAILATGAWNDVTTIVGGAFSIINNITIGMMAIWFSFLLGYYLSISRGFKNALLAGMVSCGSFLLASMGQISFFMDAKGLISAIIFGIISTEIFIKLSNVRKLKIKLPDSVPSSVANSFSALIPIFLTFSIIAVLNIVFLAPAIVTGKLFVDQNIYHTLDADGFAGLFGNNLNVTEWLGVHKNFSGHEDLVTKIFDFLNNGNQQGLVDFYNNSDNKSIIATVLATVAGANGSGDLISMIDSNAKITFTLLGDTGQYMATISWFSIVIPATQFGAGEALYKFFTSWFISFATGDGAIGLALLYVFMVSFFWFFGIHGSNMMAAIFDPIWWTILGINSALVGSMGYDFAAASGNMGVFSKTMMDSGLMVGGSGATFGLLLMTFSFSKRQELKEVAKYSVPTSVFQVNEPVLFGYPIVLNPIFGVPFILTPMVVITIQWIFSPDVLGFVRYFYMAVPWTAPWFIGQVIGSLDIKALVPAFLSLAASMAIYLPFILLDNKLYFKKLKEKNPEQYEIEMKYFNDPQYRWEFNTNKKYNALVEKSDYVLMKAGEHQESWSKIIKNEEKLKQKQDQIILKATKKQQKYLESAEKLKNSRDQKEVKLQAKWNKVKK